VWPPRNSSWVWKCVHLLISLASPLFCRLRFEGRANVPSAGGCVLTCNHVMGPDFFAVGYGSPRQVFFMGKQELFEVNPLLSWVLTNCGVFPVRRGETDLAAVDYAVQLVKSGHVLGMFPEGTRSRTGKLQRGRSGAARIAIQAQAPVVPAVVINAEPVFKRSNWLSLKPRPVVTVRFGLPLPPPTNPRDSLALRSYTRHIMQCMADLAAGAMATAGMPGTGATMPAADKDIEQADNED
jgi:1-acyl-sn-glycerol-3-phosphate acyltransferase